MLAEVVKPEYTLPWASIYLSRRSQTGIYSPMGFHIFQQKKSNQMILAQGLPYMLAEEVKPEVYLSGASIYVSRRSQTGRYSPRGYNICQQKKSKRKILSHGLPYMLAEEVKPDNTLPVATIYVSRRIQSGRYSSSGFHICQQKKSNRTILSQGLPYMLAEEVKPEETLPAASIYVSRSSQTERYSPRGFHIYQEKQSNRKILSQGLQQKQSNRKILSQGLPYMLAEEVKPEDTLPVASIYVSKRSQTGTYSPRGFHICQQKKSNRKIISYELPYMFAEEVKPEDSLPRDSIYVSRRSQTGRYSSGGFHIEEDKPEETLPGASIYVSRRSQTGKYSPSGFHICQQKKSNRKILAQGLPYMLAEEVKPEDTLPWASIYVSRRSQTGRFSSRGFHICQQKKSNRKIISNWLPYMLAEEVKPEETLPGASIYVSRRSQIERYSPSGFHICQQKKSNRKIISNWLPYMLAEEVKPEDTLPSASIYVSRRGQTGRYSPRGFHICQQKKSNRKILSQGLPYVSRRSQTGRYSPRGFHICQQKKSNRKFISQGLPYMLAEVVKP